MRNSPRKNESYNVFPLLESLFEPLKGTLATARYFIFSTDSCALLPFIATVVKEAHWTVRHISRNGSLEYVGFQFRNASSTGREHKNRFKNKFECYWCHTSWEGGFTCQPLHDSVCGLALQPFSITSLTPPPSHPDSTYKVVKDL